MWHKFTSIEDKGELESPYLSKQLIAYIGNKRKLLGFLDEVWGSLGYQKGSRFIDPFAGSGAVSRLAKYKGFHVKANDWEPYSQIMNNCFVGIHQRDTREMFAPYGGVAGIFKHLNNLKNAASPYMARYYSPKSTDEADYRTERLFFTKENGIFIDNVREEIERLYPGPQRGALAKEKDLLLASLLYEVSTHSNTNGVFKAFHKGFGGHGKDALGRIMKPMKLKVPHLIDSTFDMKVFMMDAKDFASQNSADLCYLDPPYNMHQYGSNYHILNTVALWDKPEAALTLKADGKLKEKAGIRKDWVQTKSPFCYKKDAPGAFQELLNNIDARHVMLSYNTEGIIPFEQLYDMMSSQGKTELYLKDYILYRGGRQSISRKNYNMEILLVQNRKEKPGKYDHQDIQRFLLGRKVLQALKGSFVPQRLYSQFSREGKAIRLWINGPLLETYLGYRLTQIPKNMDSLSEETLTQVYEKLEACQCKNHQEESQVLMELLQSELPQKEMVKLGKRLLQVLRKFAFKKYKEEFEFSIKIVKKCLPLESELLGFLKQGLDELEEIALLRFNG